MTFQQLKILLAVARHGSFTRASQELHVSQPALSLHIRQLEEEVGQPLFDRTGKGVTLTEAGRLAEQYALRIFAQLRELEEGLEELRGVERGELVIGASTTPGNYLLPQIIGEFRRRYPKIAVHLDVANSREMVHRILRNEIDLALVGGRLVQDERLVVEPYVVDELVLVVAPTHPWARRQHISPNDLYQEPLILRESGSATRWVMEEAFRARGIQYQVGMELGQTEAIKGAVAAGIGVAILSRFAVAHEVACGTLAAVRLEGVVLTRDFVIVRLREKRQPAAALAFREILEDERATIAERPYPGRRRKPPSPARPERP